MIDLQTNALIYLATPYTRYVGGITLAFERASSLAADLIKRGLNVYSPIAHTHPIAVYGNIDPLDHGIWLNFDAVMMTKADALMVAKLHGWTESYGVRHEIEQFKSVGKPIFYLDPISMDISSE